MRNAAPSELLRKEPNAAVTVNMTPSTTATISNERRLVRARPCETNATLTGSWASSAGVAYNRGSVVDSASAGNGSTAHTAAPARVHPLSKVWIRIRLLVITTVTGSGPSWGPVDYGTNSAGSAVG